MSVGDVVPKPAAILAATESTGAPSRTERGSESVAGAPQSRWLSLLYLPHRQQQGLILKYFNINPWTATWTARHRLIIIGDSLAILPQA